MLMKSDMSYFVSGGRNNSDWYEYDVDLLAVADGVVTQVIDGIWENTPPTPNANITFDKLGGNMVIIDIGGGNYAQYGHLIPGTATVRVGDHVTKGQVIGKLGNSGNSNGPHLHFQVGSDPYSITASEGLPFLIDHFRVDGKLIADERTGPVELIHYEPSQAWSSSWFTNYDWTDYGDLAI
jgi:murein DD-endopeptidase MepM/ murein hydrolase activator NlpD